MKYFAASILLISLLAQNCSRYLVMLNYEINKEYIANNLCENRNKPKCCCRGKCYLKKQLAKTDRDTGIPEKNCLNDKNEVLYFEERILPIERCFFTLPSIVYHTDRHALILSNFRGSIFHPPRHIFKS